MIVGGDVSVQVVIIAWTAIGFIIFNINNYNQDTAFNVYTGPSPLYIQGLLHWIDKIGVL